MWSPGIAIPRVGVGGGHYEVSQDLAIGRLDLRDVQPTDCCDATHSLPAVPSRGVAHAIVDGNQYSDANRHTHRDMHTHRH